MTYDREQLSIIREIRRTGAKRYGRGSPEYRRRVRAAMMIGRVESGFKNLPGGDADSKGWRQERGSLYPNPRNVTASINRVFDEMEQLDRGQAPWRLAADVQRPRADLRTRYRDVRKEAIKLTRGGKSLVGGMTRGRAPQLKRGGTETDTRAALLDALLAGGKGSLLKRWQANIRTGAYTTTTKPKVVKGQSPKYAGLGKLAAPGGGGGGGIATFDGKPVMAKFIPELRWARAHGWKGQVTSGVRTKEQQLAAARSFGLQHYGAAGPLGSNHVKGHRGAVDVSDPDGLEQALRKYPGRRLLRRGMADDPVHFSPTGR